MMISFDWSGQSIKLHDKPINEKKKIVLFLDLFVRNL